MSKSSRIFFILIVFNLVFFIQAYSTQPCLWNGYEAENSHTVQDTLAKSKSTDSDKSDTISVDSVKAEKRWKFSDTYIGGSVSWKNEEDFKESDYELRFGTSLTGRLDKIDLKLESQYKSKKDSHDDNEQYARINWYHTVYHQFYLLGQGRLERDQLAFDGKFYDYILLQEGVGPGYDLKFKKAGGSRISVLYDFIQVNLFDTHIPFNQQAVSFYIDNNYNLTKKLNFSNWTNIIFWDRNEVGFDMESELVYKIIKNLGLGLRHTYFLNGPTLQKVKSSELKIYIKITI